jgi:hypothetical protein
VAQLFSFGNIRMTALITIFILTLAAAIILPTLPSSRRVRLVISVVSLFAVIALYRIVEARASYIGAVHMDYFVERSQQLLQEGKTQVVIAAYRDYQEQHGSTVPKAVAPAYRAWLLESLLRQREIQEQQQQKK